MTAEQLEVRLERIERAVAEVQRRAGVQAHESASPRNHRWELLGSTPTPAEAEAFEESLPYREYIRQTGTLPPPEWNPRDPIPEPGHWR